MSVLSKSGDKRESSALDDQKFWQLFSAAREEAGEKKSTTYLLLAGAKPLLGIKFPIHIG